MFILIKEILGLSLIISGIIASIFTVIKTNMEIKLLRIKGKNNQPNRQEQRKKRKKQKKKEHKRFLSPLMVWSQAKPDKTMGT